MILFSQPFVLERDMLEPLLNRLPNAAPSLCAVGTRVAHEPMIGRIIPDVLLAGSFSGYTLLARARLTFLHCHALAMAHDLCGVSQDRMRSELHVPASVAERILKDLIRREFIESRLESYVVTDVVALRHTRLVAIEIKMRRWREALAQARSYLAFADQALVALDGNQVKLDPEMLNTFRDAGVGLLLQYGRFTMEAIPAPASPVMSPERVWAFTKLARSPHP